MMNPSPDAALVAAFAAGDRTAGDALFSRHLGDVRAYLTARCRDGDLAAELTQEVAARVSIGAKRLRADGNLGGYLVQVARNVWRDWLRHELVRRRAALTLGRDIPEGTTVEHEFLDRELTAVLRRAIERLPEPQRQVVELRHQGDITFQQIADRLGRPLGTVLTQMRSAMQRMQEAMKEYR